ncbi:MAG: alpha/beta hydrolase [Proteobacteria bacterium]|nr:alpha/beta hydrolase [Pseudomonadota bacterium]
MTSDDRSSDPSGTFLIDGDANAATTVVLAHGAGAPMDTPFMDAFAQGLGAAGLCVVRFEFPFMRARRSEGKRKPPDRAPVLLGAWRSVIAALGDPGTLVIGGKSMGGRMASMVADEAGVKGVACLGYPFHPSGKPEQTRTDHLESMRTQTLIVQGTRDSLGKPEEVAGYSLSNAVRVHWLEAGDHSFKPTKASGRTLEQNWQEGIAAVTEFVEGL